MDKRKPFDVRPLPAGYRPSALTKELAKLIIDAVYDDENGEGCDIGGGMLGPKLSAIVEHLAACKEKADLFDMLEECLGHGANDTLAMLSITKCEMVGTVRIQEVKFNVKNGVWRTGGDTLLQAARTFSNSHPYDEEL